MSPGNDSGAIMASYNAKFYGQPITSLPEGLPVTCISWDGGSAIDIPADGIHAYHTSHPKRVRDLTDELEALSGVLGPLSETLKSSPDIDLSSLDLPLLRCGNACKEFQDELLKCSSRSDNSRVSFRDWAKLRYMGDDIDSFRRLLAGYKLTITIALTDATLWVYDSVNYQIRSSSNLVSRNSTATAESIKSYKTLVETATDDLQAHLESINEKLERVFGRRETDPSSGSTELSQMKEEISSTQRCLQICDRLSEHISQIQIPKRSGGDSPGVSNSGSIPERVINEGLQECRDSLLLTTARLEKHMKDLMTRMLAKSNSTMTSDNDNADLARLQEEWETARQCIQICSKADGHLKENVSVIDNYATGDAIQFMVSTDGKTIHGKNRGHGWRTRQVGGHLSDATVVQLSQDMSRISIQTAHDKDGTSLPSNPISSDAMERDPDPRTWERHGRGFRLQPKSDAEAVPSASESTDRCPSMTHQSSRV
ncbi:uncharacterized protein A1O9_09460 [Exophiala aquamarina CBS 119918]|uniref:Azaphilone pigments biosynthesis cluster protein L N-terminal domain-containing protein n=1 Tax=Exophiala aquamarina CBS 119918 TaxID=1182545 RepID=A0A072P2I8_9EURO|nr:uncharacterized protein A1O9_09460 [Exophiala aquamarina CBS 119918]KEF54294.1 hypothetical protein A1O9_09460 [Exophiala aquamarina CBS 119918]